MPNDARFAKRIAANERNQSDVSKSLRPRKASQKIMHSPKCANDSATSRYAEREKSCIAAGKTKTTIGYVQAVSQTPHNSFCFNETFGESPKNKIGVSIKMVVR